MLTRGGGGGRAMLACALAICNSSGAAEIDPDAGRWLVQVGVYGRHYGSRPELNENYRLLGLEYQWPERWLVGATVFSNSYDQPCQMIYGGRLWRPFEERAPLLHLKLVAALVHGYKGEHQDNIPFNDYGVAPIVLPAVGLSGNRFTSEVVFYYRAGFLVTVGILF